MLLEFGYIPLFFLIAIGFGIVNLTLSRILQPHQPSEEKKQVYDCGEPPIGGGFIQYNMRFYLIAFVFVIFDVEIAFMYPVTAVFKDLVESGWGILAFVEVSIFVLILLVGFIYAWTTGGLDWVRDQKVKLDEKSATAP